MAHTTYPIHSNWAFGSSITNPYEQNRQSLNELNEKFKISTSDSYFDDNLRKFIKYTPEELDQFDVVIGNPITTYARKNYQIIKNKPGLSSLELALICDDGNLCFGYHGGSQEGQSISIYTD